MNTALRTGCAGADGDESAPADEQQDLLLVLRSDGDGFRFEAMNELGLPVLRWPVADQQADIDERNQPPGEHQRYCHGDAARNAHDPGIDRIVAHHALNHQADERRPHDHRSRIDEGDRPRDDDVTILPHRAGDQRIACKAAMNREHPQCARSNCKL